MFIKKIVNNIYLGNHMTVLNYNLLKKNNIDYVINCTKNKYEINENIKEINFPSYDPPSKEDFKYIVENINNILKEIHELDKNNKKIVIFCNKGRHRSVLLCIAYLIYKFKIKCNLAYRIVKYIHPESFSHIGKSMIYLLMIMDNIIEK